MSDDLTEPLIENKSVSFAENVFVRESDLERTNGERHYSLDGDNTNSTRKNKSSLIGKTRFGSSATAEKLEPEQLAKIKNEDKIIREKDDYLKKNGKEEFIDEFGEGEYKRLYVCDDEKKCCGDKCIILGGKKTKRRRYTKKHRSRKSRRSKKSSKNNKKK